jgi:uncharacterized FlaG/YvyC family protein
MQVSAVGEHQFRIAENSRERIIDLVAEDRGEVVRLIPSPAACSK